MAQNIDDPSRASNSAAEPGAPPAVEALGHAAKGRDWGVLKMFFVATAFGALLFGGLLAWAAMRTGSVRAGLAFLGGDYVSAIASGPIEAPPGKLESTIVRFTNLSDERIRIVGFNNPCNCISVPGLPLSLGSHEFGALRVETRPRDEPQSMKLMFLTDKKDQGIVSVDIQILPTKVAKP